MEENKIVGKEVKLGTNKNTKKELTYEELKTACAQLSNQNKQMAEYIQNMQMQMRQMDALIQSKRMDYLFKVMELSTVSHVFDSPFIGECAKEIQMALTPQEEEPTSEHKEN